MEIRLLAFFILMLLNACQHTSNNAPPVVSSSIDTTANKPPNVKVFASNLCISEYVDSLSRPFQTRSYKGSERMIQNINALKHTGLVKGNNGGFRIEKHFSGKGYKRGFYFSVNSVHFNKVRLMENHQFLEDAINIRFDHNNTKFLVLQTDDFNCMNYGHLHDCMMDIVFTVTNGKTDLKVFKLPRKITINDFNQDGNLDFLYDSYEYNTRQWNMLMKQSNLSFDAGFGKITIFTYKDSKWQLLRDSHNNPFFIDLGLTFVKGCPSGKPVVLASNWF